jgi:cobalamin biosynthesis protein CobT
MVIDHSSSMNGFRSQIAQGILTAVSSDLDKLRIPFGAVGFTYGEFASRKSDDDARGGVRSQKATLNHIKGFNEPYRAVRHRFVWPTNTNCTAELPGIEFAARQLAMRRETKKILFILTDGETETGCDVLDYAMRVATKEFIERMLKAGVRIVGIGIQNTSMEEYCPDFIHVQDLSNFAHDFYVKLMKLIL